MQSRTIHWNLNLDKDTYQSQKKCLLFAFEYTTCSKRSKKENGEANEKKQEERKEQNQLASVTLISFLI